MFVVVVLSRFDDEVDGVIGPFDDRTAAVFAAADIDPAHGTSIQEVKSTYKDTCCKGGEEA